MSLSKENKIIRIKEQVLKIPNKYKIHSLCLDLESKTEEELSSLLEKIRLKIYKLSDKGKVAENNYQKSEKGKQSSVKKYKKYRTTEKYENFKNTKKKESNKRYREKHKDIINQKQREYYASFGKEYRNKNKQTLNEKQRKNWKDNENYRIKQLLRHRLWLCVKKQHKKSSVLKLLGCTLDEFKTYFQSKFTPSMTWEQFMNGEIHIDHIMPCSSFDLTDFEEQKKCFHYTNLQPLWPTSRIIDNIQYIGNINKGNRI